MRLRSPTHRWSRLYDGITPEGAAVTGGAVGAMVGATLAFGYTVMTGRAKGIWTPEVSEEEPSEEGHDTRPS